MSSSAKLCGKQDIISYRITLSGDIQSNTGIKVMSNDCSQRHSYYKLNQHSPV